MTNNLENTHKHADSCKGIQGASQRECRGNRQESAGAEHPKQGERHVQRPDLGQGIEGVLRSKAETQRGEGGGGGRPCPQARTGLQGQQGCRAGSGDREEAEGGPKRPGCRRGEDVQPPAPGLWCLSLALETLHYKKKKKGSFGAGGVKISAGNQDVGQKAALGSPVRGRAVADRPRATPLGLREERAA